MTIRVNDGPIGVVGCGQIGAGWACVFLAGGHDVVAWDPDPKAEERLRAEVDRVWPDIVSLGRAEGPAPHDRLEFVSSLNQLSNVVFVQESAPEECDLKRNLLRDLDSIVPPSVLIASSTSGFKQEQLSELCENPNRIVVGHPFLPVHLLPLVEIVSPDAAAAAEVKSLYEDCGKKVVVLEKDVTGFIANRLQEAIWREAIHMIDAGEATAEQIDIAVTEGPGLRWAFMGPIRSYDLAGGLSSVQETVKDFREYPSSEDYTRLPSIEISDAVEQDLIESITKLRGGFSFPELCARRDRLLIEILNAKARLQSEG